MNELALFGGSFIFVFALSSQQQNILCRRYCWAGANAAFIAGLNLFVVKMGAQASPSETIAFIAGQPMGTLLAIWLNERRLTKNAEREMSVGRSVSSQACPR